MSLSHCWGLVPSDAPWKLTNAQLASYSREIPLSIPPLTSRQAIEYTRKLSEKYLWIDSLFIIQDSAEDWSMEASKMAAIYANSICTLSAATASSSEDCMLTRASWIKQPLEIKLDSGGKAFLVSSVPGEGELQHAVPVTGRTWCLRELTNRLIQFTPYQWLWSCKTASTSERIVRDLNNTTLSFTSIGNAGLKYHRADTSQTQGTRADGIFSDEREVKDYIKLRRDYEMWYEVVEVFTRCQITYPSDRLPAIAGMVHRQQDKTTDRYVAGLWEKESVFWTRLGLQRTDDRLNTSHPAGHIPVTFKSFMHYKNHQSLTLISAHIVRAGPDPLGMVQGGHLHLRGRLKAAKTTIAKLEMPSGHEKYEETFRSFSSNNSNGALSILRIDTNEDAKACDEVICLSVLEAHGIALKSIDVERPQARPAYRRVGHISAVTGGCFEDVEEVEFDLY